MIKEKHIKLLVLFEYAKTLIKNISKISQTRIKDQSNAYWLVFTEDLFGEGLQEDREGRMTVQMEGFLDTEWHPSYCWCRWLTMIVNINRV